MGLQSSLSLSKLILMYFAGFFKQFFHRVYNKIVFDCAYLLHYNFFSKTFPKSILSENVALQKKSTYSCLLWSSLDGLEENGKFGVLKMAFRKILKLPH